MHNPILAKGFEEHLTRPVAERVFAKIDHLRALCLDPIQKLLLLVVDLVGWVSQKNGGMLR